jgi:hypothetical protein
MDPGLIVLLVLVAWALGPLILRVAGGLLLVGTLLAVAFGNGNENQLSLLIGGVAGALMLLVGIAWGTGREAGRGPLIWSLAVDLLALWRGRRHQGRLGHTQWDEAISTSAGYGPLDPQQRPRRWRIPRLRTRETDGPAAGDTFGERGSWGSGANRTAHGQGVGGTVVDGVARDVSADAAEDEAARIRSLREDVDRTLEEAHGHLEPIIYELFVWSGGGWRERLSAARWTRRSDLPEIDGGPRPFEDRRTLFSVIAYDWTLIGSHFKSDPSDAGRTLCAVANRYAHEGPRESDPAAARDAFGEICAALRPQSVYRVLNPTKSWF